mmetsp:Transcript_13617/g.40581  ORF Transcript_13617/g.40581 Transcript_13617/m.40581 type:complete len:226 (+) Transcript_13617:94-771(+)
MTAHEGCVNLREGTVGKAVAPRRLGVMPRLVDVRTKKVRASNQRMPSRHGEGHQVYDPRSSGPPHFLLEPCLWRLFSRSTHMESVICISVVMVLVRRLFWAISVIMSTLLAPPFRLMQPSTNSSMVREPDRSSSSSLKRVALSPALSPPIWVSVECTSGSRSTSASSISERTPFPFSSHLMKADRRIFWHASVSSSSWVSIVCVSLAAASIAVSQKMPVKTLSTP